MRISTMMIFDNLLRNLTKSIERTQKIQEVISTGKEINTLSDDPFGIAQVINYQSDLTKLSQYKDTIAYGNSWLNMSDSILQDIQNLVGEAKNIAITQSTSTMNSETRAQAAVMVQNLYEQLIGYGNTKLAGSYIFGGSITDNAPFNADGTYNGNGDDIMVEIIEGVVAKINLAGSEFLITDLNPALSTAAATSGSTSSTGLAARNINTILTNPSGLSEHTLTFVLNGLTQEVTYTTDTTPTQDELGTGMADAVNNHNTLNRYIRAYYDTTTGNITFEAKEVGTEGNVYTIDEATTTAFEGTVHTSFAGGRSEITSGFVFVGGANSSIVFQENGVAVDITADLITDGEAISGRVYTGDQVASFIERAMESQSATDPNGNAYTYTVSYDETTDLFTIVNDAGNGGTLNVRWSASSSYTGLGFNNVDSGFFAAGGSDVSNNQVEFNVLNNVNDRFRITVDGVGSGVIDINAGPEAAYTAANLAAAMQAAINADAALAAASVTVTVDFGTTISGQFSITSDSTGTGSTVSLSSDATQDFLGTVGLGRDFEVSGTSPTPLAKLNGGAGVTAGNISITDRFGRSATIAVSASDSVADVINNINGAVCVFDATNSDIVFSENGGADITANIITHGGAISGRAYAGDQVASCIEQAMETAGTYDYTVTYNSLTNRFTIVNNGNPGTLELKWSAAGATAEQELGFQSVDSGAFAAGLSDTSDYAVDKVVNVTAQVNSAGNGITIIDNNSAPVQNLVVANNATASDLGIVGNKPGAIYGSDLNPAVTNATRISALKGGAGVTLGALSIVNGLIYEKIDLSRAGSITDILNAINDLSNDLNMNVTASINPSKSALDVNSTSASTAAVVCEVEGGTTSSDLGIQGASDFLKTLAVLKEALEKNDRYGLLNILDQFDLILATLVEKGSGVGVRTSRLEAMNSRIATTEFEISELKSEIEDADMVEYLTKFAMQQTALEAVMSITAQSMQLSLLNFLR